MTLKDFEAKFKFLPVAVDSCVEKVMKQGHDKSSAIAICRSALGMGAEPREAGRVRDVHNRGNDGDDTKKVFEFELDPLWKQTKEVMGIEIFQTGIWKDRNWTDQDLQDAVQNFRNGILGAEPYITIDHEPKATDEFSKALDGMALGFVKNLYKVGKKLVADFTKVPRVIAELMMAGPLKNKSIELWPEFEAADGNIYHNVLEAVTLTGKIPAVSGLSDVVALFKRETGIAQKGDRRKIKLTTGGHKMSEITIEQSEYTGLLKFKAQSEVHADEIVKFKAETVNFKKEIEIKDAKIVELEKFKADTAKRDQEREHNKAVQFAERLITKGKIIPAQKDYYVEQYKMNKAKGPEMFKAFTDIHEKKEAVVITGEFAARGQADGKGVSKVDGDRARENFKKESFKGKTQSAYDDLHKAVTAYMEKHGVTYEEAAKHLKLLQKPIQSESDARDKMDDMEDARKEQEKAEEEDKGKDDDGKEEEEEEEDEE